MPGYAAHVTTPCTLSLKPTSPSCLQVKPAQCVDVVNSAKSPSARIFFARLTSKDALGCQLTNLKSVREKEAVGEQLCVD